MKDKYYMTQALVEANKAYELGEVPVGAVVVFNDEIIGRGYNQKENKKDATKHAELIAISEASKTMNNWRLDDCAIYVTLEPCTMCASAIMQSRITRVIFALEDNTDGAVITSKHILENTGEHRVLVKDKVLYEEAKSMMDNFFNKSRMR